MDTRRLLRTFAIGIGTAGLLISGCSGSGSSPNASATGTAAPEAVDVLHAEAELARLRGVEGFECTTMKAPRDYDQPDEGDIELAVSRKKATGPGKRIGSLLVNPGGPGGSAIGYLQGTRPSGIPPRCGPATTWWPSIRAAWPQRARRVPHGQGDGRLHPGRPDTGRRRGGPKLTAAFEKFAAGCETRSGEILPYVSTVDTASRHGSSCVRCSATRSCTTSGRRTAPSWVPRTRTSSRSGRAAWSWTARWTRP